MAARAVTTANLARTNGHYSGIGLLRQLLVEPVDETVVRHRRLPDERIEEQWPCAEHQRPRVGIE